MYPKNKTDYYLVVAEASDALGWLTGMLAQKMYYGSGSCWFDSNDKRVNDWKSSDLHSCYTEGLNKALEKKNCK